jgi:hypothetical protein
MAAPRLGRQLLIINAIVWSTGVVEYWSDGKRRKRE